MSTDIPGSKDETALVAGATGDTGKEVVRYLGDTEIKTRAMTRSESKKDGLVNAGADEVVVGDLFEREDAERAVEGVDTVLSTVGSTPKQILTRDEFVDGTGNINLARAASDEGVRHLVMESAIGVGDEATGVFGASIDLFLKPIQEAKSEAEAEIRSLSLGHTILRPGGLAPVKLSPSPQVAKAGSKLWGGVSRKTVARLMAASPYTPAVHSETLEVVENLVLSRKDIGVDWNYPDAR